MKTSSVDVILPAGGRIAGEFAQHANTTIKALIRLGGGETILSQTIAALRASGRTGRIVVVGPAGDAGLQAAASGADALLPEGETGPDNIFRALAHLQTGENSAPARPALIVTTDLPFASAEAIAGFLNACPDDADLCVPVIERAAYEARFPGTQNEWVRLVDGEWTVGGASLVRPDALERSRPHLERVFAARKNQVAMARLLGPVFVARFLLRRLGVPHIERRCSDLIRVRGVAVRGGDPVLAFDIDTPKEWRYAVEWAGSPPAVKQYVQKVMSQP